jgi:FAD/FMN-containing dehydrogenase
MVKSYRGRAFSSCQSAKCLGIPFLDGLPTGDHPVRRHKNGVLRKQRGYRRIDIHEGLFSLAVKAEYDPTNLFRVNQNIQPVS